MWRKTLCRCRGSKVRVGNWSLRTRKATGNSGIQRSLPGVQWTREVLLIKEARWLHIGTLSYLFFPSLNASRSQRPAGQRIAGSALLLLAALSAPERLQAATGPRVAPMGRRFAHVFLHFRDSHSQYIDSSSVHHHPPLPLPNCLPRTLNVSYLARLPPIGSTLGSLRCPVGDYGGGATMYFQRYGAAVTYRDGPGTHIYIPLTSS